MRSLKATLRPDRPIVLPLAYNELLQGLLYSCWKESFPDLHDRGFGSGKMFRMFVFGPLTGKRTIDAKAKTIRFEDAITFEVRSVFEELIDELARGLGAREKVRIGAYDMDLVNLETCDRLLFPKRAIIKTLSPIVVYTTDESRHTRYYSPEENEWLDLMQRNTDFKAETLGIDSAQAILAIPRQETMRKQVTKFKGTFVTGWMGEWIVAADPTVLSLLYYAGLGAKNSQGFGMFTILDRKP